MTLAITSTIGCARPSGADFARYTLVAPYAQPGRRVVGDVPDHHDPGVASDLGGQLRRLGDGAQRVLVEAVLVVVEGVDQNPRHLSTCLARRATRFRALRRLLRSISSSSQATIFSTVSEVSSSSMISPACFSGGGLIASTWVFEPASPTSGVSIPTSPVALASSGFFLAPMIAFSEG